MLPTARTFAGASAMAMQYSTVAWMNRYDYERPRAQQRPTGTAKEFMSVWLSIFASAFLEPTETA